MAQQKKTGLWGLKPEASSWLQLHLTLSAFSKFSVPQFPHLTKAAHADSHPVQLFLEVNANSYGTIHVIGCPQSES